MGSFMQTEVYRNTEMGFFMQTEVLVACACVCFLTVFILLLAKLAHRRTKKLHLPPTPPGRPIIGHLHLLQKPIHQSLQRLSQSYGPFFFIYMGSKPTVVLSSQVWIKEVLHTHDRQFAGRPQLEACKRLFYNHKTMIMMDHNPTWRHLRKLYTVQILSTKRVEMSEEARQDEMDMSMKLLRSQQALEGGPQVVDIRKLVFSIVGNMMTRMLFSKRSFDAVEDHNGEESKFHEMVEEMSVLMGTPVLSDLIPWLGWLNMQANVKRKMDRLAGELDAFLEKVLVERIESKGELSNNGGGETVDYLDLLLDLYKEDGMIDKESIKCILLDILVASTDTTTTTIEWALAELVQNDAYMKKLQEEIDNLVNGEAGGDSFSTSRTSKCVKGRELAKLSYLQAVIRESLRLHPPLAMVFRQMCKDVEKGGVEVGGYELPKDTRVIFNIWAMGRDTTIWGPNADSFCPDRFLNKNAPDPRGQHFQFIPFGTGRRVCPGMNLALSIVPLILANLVYGFSWNAPQGQPLDLSDASAFTAPMAKPLVLLATLRA